MVQAITEWTLCLEEAEMSLDIVRVRWERESERLERRRKGGTKRGRARVIETERERQRKGE